MNGKIIEKDCRAAGFVGVMGIWRAAARDGFNPRGYVFGYCRNTLRRFDDESAAINWQHGRAGADLFFIS